MGAQAVSAAGDGAVGVLEPRLVGDITGHFSVPGYQRGYRWGRHEVAHLLRDIEQSNGSYFLQPVVVKRHDGHWELVDGQQRLTTLYLVLQYIQEHLPTQSAKYTMEYETRPASAAYLDDTTEALHHDNIDFFHIWQAGQCIREWFEGHDDSLQAAIDFRTALTKRVYVIWYEAPDELDSRTLFTRLNVGRIPLTDAELVKAVLLSKAERPLEVAAQWDSIERDLRAPEVWSFVTGRVGREATHISLLLDTAAGGPVGTARPLFHTFETLRQRIDQTGAEAVWDEVIDLHSLVQGWFDDRDLFHKIGYLVATGSSFRELVLAAKGITRTSFEQTLDDRIRDRINVSRSSLADLGYETHYAKCERVLLLMNVETVRRRQHSTERYSYAAHAQSGWSLEHINAQSAETLSRAEQWTEWLRLHRDALDALPDLDASTRNDLVDRINVAMSDISETKFRGLEQEVVSIFTAADLMAEDDVHFITNLALLAGADNSVLSNACFEVKRQNIIRLDRNGSFIPAATRNVFLKYYTEAGAQQIHFWSPQDRTAYLDALADSLDPYLIAEADDGE